MIPDGIECEHLAKAVAEIEQDGVPKSRESVHYDYVFSGKKYPPKYVISLAAKYAFGKELRFNEFNAVAAKDYLLARGEKIIDRRQQTLPNVVDKNDESAYPEGAKRFKMHQRRERDSSIAVKAKKIRLAETGKLKCEACGFDFAETYGPLGEGFAEAHHTIPVSELDGGQKTKVGDLAIVCSNCHRMLHRQKSNLTILELQALMDFDK